jgi:hypothetical protein
MFMKLSCQVLMQVPLLTKTRRRNSVSSRGIEIHPIPFHLMPYNASVNKIEDFQTLLELLFLGSLV